MAASQVFLHSKLSFHYYSARYFDNKSELPTLDYFSARHFDRKLELLLPIKKDFPTPGSISSTLMTSTGKGEKLKTCNQFCRQTVASNEFSKTRDRLYRQRVASDDFSSITAKHGMCTSEDALISDHRSGDVAEVASTGVRNIESFPAGSISAKVPCKGLGIVDSFKAQNFLITGATGFVAKVLIVKILMMQPDIGKLFLIIRAGDSASALKRLKTEVINAELFKCLRETYGDEYEDFMLKKLVPVAGDMAKHNLGIEEDKADMLREDVDIIVSSAATTRFDERYDVALETNTTGVYRLLEFSKCCKNVVLFIHLSTAYVNGLRHGLAEERPFQMGHSITKEKEELIPPLNIHDEFHLANKVREGLEIELSNFQNCNKGQLDCQKKIAQTMRDLGMERARSHGWQDTYTFTKAMAEMLIVSGREDLPVVIVRPSVIESTYSQPFPGWIEGHRMLDPIITFYGKGQLSSVMGDPETPLDVVPVDMVVNATLAAIAKHIGKPGLKVYHVASSVANPIKIGKIFNIIFEHFKCNPYINNKGEPVRLLKQITCVHNMEEFCARNLDTSRSSIAGLSASVESVLEKRKPNSLISMDQLKHIAKIYEPYGFYKGRFDISNSKKLFQEMSEEEQESFGFDVKNIQWKDYIGNIHIKGVRQHVMKGRGSGKPMINISTD